mmetsp:Transcript_22906/g.90837  ORF Transcript_22906/g.90837 Transcript_22906/m.90837 type:complete len:366 (+) Transcript_22906:663-1760(+)
MCVGVRVRVLKCRALPRARRRRRDRDDGALVVIVDGGRREVDAEVGALVLGGALGAAGVPRQEAVERQHAEHGRPAELGADDRPLDLEDALLRDELRRRARRDRAEDRVALLARRRLLPRPTRRGIGGRAAVVGRSLEVVPRSSSGDVVAVRAMTRRRRRVRSTTVLRPPLVRVVGGGREAVRDVDEGREDERSLRPRRRVDLDLALAKRFSRFRVLGPRLAQRPHARRDRRRRRRRRRRRVVRRVEAPRGPRAVDEPFADPLKVIAQRRRDVDEGRDEPRQRRLAPRLEVRDRALEILDGGREAELMLAAPPARHAELVLEKPRVLARAAGRPVARSKRRTRRRPVLREPRRRSGATAAATSRR